MRAKTIVGKRKDSSSTQTVKIHRVLVPLDFSSCSQKSLAYAKALAASLGGQLVLMNVVEPYFPTGELAVDLARVQIGLEENAKQALEKYRQAAGPGARAIVRVGSPSQAITEEAKALKADLIVIATHGRTGFSHLALGSVAERVVRHAPCPVLVVRDKEHDFIAFEPPGGGRTRLLTTKVRRTTKKRLEAV